LQSHPSRRDSALSLSEWQAMETTQPRRVLNVLSLLGISIITWKR
jgi:hypothetical protein